MARVTPEQAAQKWASRLSGATQEITQGVQGVSTAPGVAAARQKTAYLQNVQANVDKWANRVASVPLDEWKSKMVNVGIPRIAQGAQANLPKMAQFMSEFLPHVDQVAARVRSMPKVTLQDGIARAVAQIQGNAQFRRGGGGRTV